MPACNIERIQVGPTATFRIGGAFESSCAWDLSARIAAEPLASVVLDFSRVGDFADYGIAVLANALLAQPHKTVELRGLRQHQRRLFKYFGVESNERVQEAIDLTGILDPFLDLSRGAA